MTRQPIDDLTALLGQVNGGCKSAFVELIDLVYEDLRHIAANEMRQQFGRPLASLTRAPTEIANDAIMELRRQYSQWRNHEQFFAIATRLIHRLVLQYQRRRLAKKAGAGNRGVPLQALSDEPPALVPLAPSHSPALEALRLLHQQHPRAAEIVTLHVVCEHPLPKIAEMLGLSLRTVEREWSLGRVWLRGELTRTHV